MNKEVEQYITEIAEARWHTKNITQEIMGDGYTREDLDAVWDAYVESCLVDAQNSRTLHQITLETQK